MPNIDVSGETYSRLQNVARPFEDTPDTVIARLLDAYAHAEAARAAGSPRQTELPRRATVGQILPEGEYWIPILQALVELGGSAPAVEVIDRVGELLRDKLKPVDREQLRTGGTRWKKRTQFARFKMVTEGLLDRNAPRGVWAVTDKGRRYLEQREGS